jgi:predicted lipoprotein with Yx(FWY)xxD motif
MHQHRSPLVLAACASLLALALAGCGGSSPSSQHPESSAPAASASGYGPGGEQPNASSKATSSLKTATVNGQTIVVDANGMPVYFYTLDNQGEPKSACLGGCATLWPAVTSDQPPQLQGITAKVGSITAADGSKQVTLNGLPIYYYAKDTSPGKANGQGVGGVWYVVSPDGSMMTSSPTGSRPASGGSTESVSASPTLQPSTK